MLLTDEERMKVWIPCETKCNLNMPKSTADCMNCIVIEHEKAQLKKVVEWLKENNESSADGLKLYPWIWQALLEEVK